MELSKETLTRIVQCADEVISALNGTNEDVSKNDSEKMCHLWDDLNDRFAPPEIVKEMALRLLAAEEQQPVAYREIETGMCGSIVIQGKDPSECGYEPLYLHPQQEKLPTDNAQPVCWIAMNKETGEIEIAEPNEVATNPKYWTDAFPLYLHPQQGKAVQVPDEIDIHDPALDTHRKWMAEGWNRCRDAMLKEDQQ